MNDELIEQIPVLQSVQEISHNYDAWLVDLWGVMHNGERAIETAVMACQRYREEGGIVVLLSNAPRPASSVRHQIEGYGVPSVVDDGMVTSGDVTMALIAANTGRNFFHLGPKRDLPLFEGFDVNLVKPDKADIILLSGLYNDSGETPEDYRELLTTLLARNLPMICANPDIKVERGDEVIYAAGAIAALYVEMGGQVVYGGKPYHPIYELAMAKINNLAGRNVPTERILAIGDGVDTDIKGAVRAHIDALFIPSGVHVKDKSRQGENAGKEIIELFSNKDFSPIASMPRLQW